MGSSAWGSPLAVSVTASRSGSFSSHSPAARFARGWAHNQTAVLPAKKGCFLFAACSHSCPIVSKQSVISKLLNPLPRLCCSRFPQIPTQRQLCWISFLPSREIFDRCLLLFHGPVPLCFSSEVQLFCFCTLPITEQ